MPAAHHCISVSAPVQMPLLVVLTFLFFVLSGSLGMDLGCFLEDCPTPTTEPLYTIDVAHLCKMSDIYVQEVTEEFVSRVAKIGPAHSDPKLWQLRTVAVQDSENRTHHNLFQWVITSGGLTRKMGRAAAKFLRPYGAKERETHPVLC